MKIMITDVTESDFARFDRSIHDGRLTEILGHSFATVEISKTGDLRTVKLMEVMPVNIKEAT